MNQWKIQQVPLYNLQRVLNNLEEKGYNIYSVEHKKGAKQEEHTYIIAKREIK